MSTNQKRALEAAEQLVRNHMASYDPSHDFLHVNRVRKTALRLAQRVQEEQPDVSLDIFVVELAALFHDLFDAKYSKGDDRSLLDAFFQEHAEAISKDNVLDIMKIVENVSYSKEVKRIAGGLQTPWHESCVELHCVQDADKLDAMGAVGIMRCSAYSAVVNRPLYATAAEGEIDPGCSIEHYHSKLLKLQGMLRTKEGRRLGEERHQFMLLFLDQVNNESI